MADNKTWMDRTKDVTALIAGLSAALTVVGGIAFAIAKPHISPWLDGPSKLDELINSVAALTAAMDDNRKGINDLRRFQPVAEYDESRSEVIGPCVVGSLCVARFRIRRTMFGVPCEIPSAIPYVANHARDPIRTRFQDFQPVKVAREWETLETPFVVPRSAKPGSGGFYVRITYSQCSGEDDDEIIPESTITLPFEIRAEN